MQTSRRFPVFYGWVIVASCFALMAVAYTVWYGFSLFYVAILEEFGWSRAVTAGAFSVFVLLNGLAGPLAGMALERWGPRRVIGTGIVIMAAGLAASSRISQPWHFYLFFGLVVAMGLNLATWVPNITLLTNWFQRRLGTVLGIASAGIGFGMLVFVPLTQYLIGQFGWRTTYLVLAAAVLLIMLPITLLFLRRRPQDMGLLPDGESSSLSAEDRHREQDQLIVDPVWAQRLWTVRSALATRRFWLAFACSLLLSFATQMALVHQVALLSGAGYDRMLAASAVGVVGIASLVGKMTWGMASDRVGREITFSLGMACAVVGMILLALARTVYVPWLPYLYAVWIGLGYATAAPLTPSVTADLFRGKGFASIFGVMAMAANTGGGLGAWLAGYVFDLTGDYLPALLLGMVSLLLANLCLWLAGPRQVRRVPGQVRSAAIPATPRR